MRSVILRILRQAQLNLVLQLATAGTDNQL